jgi:hypothetical protein
MARGATTCGVSRATWTDDFESGKRPCHHHLQETELITSERDGYIVVRNLLKYDPKRAAHYWFLTPFLRSRDSERVRNRPYRRRCIVEYRCRIPADEG